MAPATQPNSSDWPGTIAIERVMATDASELADSVASGRRGLPGSAKLWALNRWRVQSAKPPVERLRDQGIGGIEVRRPEPLKCLPDIDQASLGSSAQDAQRSCENQVVTTGLDATSRVVDQEKIGRERGCEGDCRALAEIQFAPATDAAEAASEVRGAYSAPAAMRFTRDGKTRPGR
jgi:hypothetical protein